MSLTNATAPVRRLSRVHALAVLVLVLLGSLLSTPRAQAAQFSGTAGRVGYVQLNGPMITGSDYRINGMAYSSVWLKAWETGSFSAGRSPSSTATQTVVAVIKIQKWTGAWTTMQQRTYHGQVSGAGTLSFPGWTWAPDTQPQYRAGYRVVYDLAWRVSATGQLLAYTTVVPSTYGDNKCRMISGSLGCSSYTDGINF
jgi:hypothetical protein